MTPEFERPELPDGDLWAFGYGSLMWRPGFDYLEMHLARLHGYHRALCIWSWVHRGTRERPGMVFGLDAGGSCVGRVFRVAAADKFKVAEYLYAREMVSQVYAPRVLSVWVLNQRVRALAFVVDRAHVQYAGRPPLDEAAAAIRTAEGKSGRNIDYLVNTVAHLREIGIEDSGLNRLLAAC